MELLLWLYLYDNRWFFRLKIPIDIYKLVWLIPLTMRLIELTIAIYDSTISTGLPCMTSMKWWLYNRCIFSLIISLNIIFFVNKISKENEKQTNHFHIGRRAFPILKSRLYEHDYWIRRNSLLSKTGIFLLFQGFVSFIWAYMIIKQFNDNNYTSCNLNIKQIINAHSIFILYANMLVFVLFSIMLSIKVIFNVLGNYFPHAVVFISKMCHRKQSNIKTYHRDSHDIYFKKLVT